MNALIIHTLQGRTEEFGEGGVQCEIDEGAGREDLGRSPRKMLSKNTMSFCIQTDGDLLNGIRMYISTVIYMYTGVWEIFMQNIRAF